MACSCAWSVTLREVRGLLRECQFALTISCAANNADTLVMQNLGYFQLKANPGVWQLQLAEGRGAELYNIVVSADADDGPGGLQWMGRRTAGDSAELVRSTKQIAVKDFTGAGTEAFFLQIGHFRWCLRVGPIAQLRVRKIPGKEEVALLEKLGAGSQADAPVSSFARSAARCVIHDSFMLRVVYRYLVSRYRDTQLGRESRRGQV